MKRLLSHLTVSLGLAVIVSGSAIAASAAAQSTSQTVSATHVAAVQSPSPTRPDTCAPGEGAGWFKTQISCLVEQTKNPLLRLIFIFLLGLLMSLTPCIYPMIPITVGILQASSQQSMARNTCAAIAYTLGIATTFALLGLAAATGGAQFGHLLANPFVILFLVIFLAYFGFSMLGLYELRLPSFLQRGVGGVRGNSIPSIFLFGAISGTVASPCLSPGLVLLLSIVATIGSRIIGFIYLFTFGIGLCIPLLIVGLFSNSVTLLPRAGTWMVEVKRIFGVLLIAMCFYYLAPLMHGCLLRGILAGTLATTGIFFFTLEGAALRWYHRIVGTLLIAAGIYAAVDAIRFWRCPPAEAFKHLSYGDARKLGISQHKKLLVDFGASWCASCREVERRVMQNEKMRNELAELIFVEIDCTAPQEESGCSNPSKKFSIIGFPTILLIEPENERVIARWGEEFAVMEEKKVVETIRQALG
ncbi:MAG: sulfite exporter TauE/SafE family protein [Candidatus Dependentiae bacterium]|nr:sulfite exporter TauE/SafE family protein [Candidatus Dependentiae bacterium]